MKQSIYNNHKQWIQVVRNFGIRDYPEDIVQDAYIKCFNKVDITNGYFYLALFSVAMDSKRKKVLETVQIIEDYNCVDVIEDTTEDINNILAFIDTWDWYDKLFYLKYIEEKTSLRKFALKYDYNYQFVYKILKKCKLKLLNYGRQRQ